MAARYWRVVALDTYGRGGLSICALHLYAARARVDAGASVSASIPPSAGSVSDLQSAALTATVEWPRAAVASAGFAITWDFGSAADVDAIRIGARDKARFPAFITLQHSADAKVWTTFATARGVSWPGAGALSALPSTPALDSRDVIAMDFEGSNGATTMVDAAGHPFAAYGGARLTTMDPLEGTSSLLLNGSTDYIETPPHSDFDLGTGAFTVRALMRPASLAHEQTLISRASAAWNRPTEWALYIRNATQLVWYRGLRGTNQAGTVFTLAEPIVLGAAYQVIMGRDAAGRRRCFVNGFACAVSYEEDAREIDTTNLDNPGANLPVAVGCFGGTTAYNFAGQIDGLRVRKGEEPPASEVEARAVTKTDAVPPLRACSTSVAVAASSPIASARAPGAFGPQTARDVEHGGAGRIWGTNEIQISGTQRMPTGGRVVLLHQRSKLPVRETWADPGTGAWAFEGLDTRQDFIALAEDLAGNYRPVAANRLTPEVP
ncbi:LamG-like jellyroll fold domain-containing protein [Acidovorax sp. MR-S7]|uniref:LamG-like jellyroll fold domain-containing protein n=1 Tax=Acidovorax sp. MR-S7 TaxID=1268622 RepID=UPI00036461DC|nr:LamG-like jellyroll fold domain-containing protein [Acidovorax sp. MR-S7]GAD22356.1 hypothetical protein AVS7_02116 [Acidovorax sp. MR-S7]